ncbi:hypothetical protein YI53_005035 [Salmonella enterica subsp. enterica]|nr:hypothetical protein [Salmonella enterica subsp. enterica]
MMRPRTSSLSQTKYPLKTCKHMEEEINRMILKGMHQHDNFRSLDADFGRISYITPIGRITSRTELAQKAKKNSELQWIHENIQAISTFCHQGLYIAMFEKMNLSFGRYPITMPSITQNNYSQCFTFEFYQKDNKNFIHCNILGHVNSLFIASPSDILFVDTDSSFVKLSILIEFRKRTSLFNNTPCVHINPHSAENCISLDVSAEYTSPKVRALSFT